VAALAAAVSLVVYLLTLAPTAFGMDSAELATAAYTLGLAHAPGYPVYLLVAHLFTRLPLGDVAYRVNLLSALAGSACIGLLTYQIRRSIANNAAALSAALALGFSFYAWSVSVAAEVYTFQALLMIAILMLAWSWRSEGRPAHLALAAGLMGLALANNPATVLWWPGLALLLWTSPHRGSLGRGDLVRALAMLAAGLSFVLYIPWRSTLDPAFAYVGQYDLSGSLVPPDLTVPANLVWYLSGQQFADFFPAVDPAHWLSAGSAFFGHLWAAMLGIGIPVGAVGLVAQWRGNRTWALGLLAIAGGHAAFFAGYGTVDRSLMLLPTFVIWSVFVAHGLEVAARGIPRRLHWAALMLPAALLIVNWPYLDLSNSEEPIRTARLRLEGSQSGALYLAPWGDAAVMHYLQHVEGVGTDVTVVNSFFVADGDLGRMIDTALEADRAVYASQPGLLPVPFDGVDEFLSFQVVPIQGDEHE